MANFGEQYRSTIINLVRKHRKKLDSVTNSLVEIIVHLFNGEIVETAAKDFFQGLTLTEARLFRRIIIDVTTQVAQTHSESVNRAVENANLLDKHLEALVLGQKIDEE